MPVRPIMVALSVVLTSALVAAQEARPPLDACVTLTEADALALLPGAKQLEQQTASNQSADREVSTCAYRDQADPSRRVTLSIQRFPTSVPSSIGWALYNDYELENVEGVARGALWKPSTATMMLVLESEFIALTVTRPSAPATVDEVREAMKKVYQRRGAPTPERSVTAP